MAFGPTFEEIRSNAKQSLASHVAYYSTIPLSPSSSPKTANDEQEMLPSDLSNFDTNHRCEQPSFGRCSSFSCVQCFVVVFGVRLLTVRLTCFFLNFDVEP